MIPAVTGRDYEALVPAHLAHAFLEKSARSAGIPNLGYIVGRDARVEGLGAFGRNLLRSLTLHDALGKIRSTFSLYSSAEQLWWTLSGSNVQFFHRHMHETGPGSRVAQQCALLLMRDLIRLAAGPDWQPSEVLMTPNRNVSAAQLAFETENVRPSEFCGFVFPAELMSLPLERFRGDASVHDRDLMAFDASAPAVDFVGSVKQIIAALMVEGRCHLNVIAEALGMHSRMLQRILADCHNDYSELLAEVRFEAAVRLLEDPKRRVIDIAFEIGYSDSANFTRAFRHWTGVSPSDFRRLRQERRQ
ncbi:helix-turn-helix domain-containing protein [Mesorhizobium sp. LjNodule214]|uniref:AraC family transcriptional regulator n=1 Tax=Mesorhizobium sp. LjNodule214 TaxID=3342252 RepID=UPI003ED0603F